MKQCDEEVIIDRYINGESRSNLGKEYGVSTNCIDNVMKKYGVKPSDVLPQKDELIGQKFNKLTILYFSHKQGAIKFYFCKCECGVTKAQNISFVKNGRIVSCGCSRRHISKVQETDILAKYESGMTCVDIAKEYGIKDHTIRRMMDRHDKKRRSNADSVRRIDLDETVFESLTRDSMYWMGFIGADGNVHGRNLKIELQPGDVDHLHKFKEFCKSGHDVLNTKKGEYVAFTFSSQRIVGSLLKFGITPNKSLTFKPYEYCANNADFWRGMIDGDGWVNTDKYYGKPYVGLCGSKDAVFAFAEWVRKNCESMAKPCKDGNIYKTSIYGTQAIVLLKKLYGNDPKYFLDRKYEVAKKFLDVH